MKTTPGSLVRYRLSAAWTLAVFGPDHDGFYDLNLTGNGRDPFQPVLLVATVQPHLVPNVPGRRSFSVLLDTQGHLFVVLSNLLELL